MSADGEPAFTFWVFDDISETGTAFMERYNKAAVACNMANDPHVKLLPHKVIDIAKELIEYEEYYVENGYEGVMLRNPLGRYKHGRSTFREQILLKLKRFVDDEAEVIGFAPLERNQNPQVRSELGLATRSSAMGGKVADDLLGYLEVRHPTYGEFHIGSGFDVTTRQIIWHNQEKFLGRQVTFKFQLVGTKDKPRQPIFKAFREVE
jgi:DNA ligase-1